MGLVRATACASANSSRPADDRPESTISGAGLNPAGAASAVFGLAGRTMCAASISPGVGSPSAAGKPQAGSARLTSQASGFIGSETDIIPMVMPGKRNTASHLPLRLGHARSWLGPCSIAVVARTGRIGVHMAASAR